MITAIYLRKSRNEEDSSLEETLRKHKEILLDFAKKNRLSITSVFEEVVSGESLYARPEMLKLLDSLENYEAILCMDIDRLGRGKMSEAGIILETIKNANVKIITPRKIYDLNNDSDEMFSEFESFIARRELKLITRRLRTGFEKTISEGAYVANAPFGYVKTIINKKPSLLINEDEAIYVRMIFDLYLSGVGMTIIANTLNDLSVKPHRSNKFGRTSIRGILRNPTYLGKIVWNKTFNNGKANNEDKKIFAEGLHEAIIDEDVFNRANEILKNKYHSTYFTGKFENPLAGLVICEKCHRKLQRRPDIDKTKPAWVLCFTNGCTAGTRQDRLEDAVIEQLNEYVNNIHFITENNGNNKSKEICIDYEKIQSDIKRQLSLLDQQQESLHDLLEQGVYDIETFILRSTAIRDKKSTLQSQLTTTNIDKTSYIKTDKVKTAKKISSILEVYRQSDSNTKNTLLKTVIKEILYNKQKNAKPTEFQITIKLKDF